MRISTSGTIESLKRQLNSQSAQLTRLYSQMSAGKRMQTLSDDPAALVRVLRAHAVLDELATRETVAQHAEQLLGAADVALGQIAESLREAKQICMQASLTARGSVERATLAAQIRALSASLVRVGNMEVQGQYIFAGTQYNLAPFQEADNANLPVLYRGNHQALAYQLRAEERVPVTLTGAEVFNYPDTAGERPVASVDQDVFSLLASLAEAMEREDMGVVEQAQNALDQLQAYVIALRARTGVYAQRWKQVQEQAQSTRLLLQQVLADDESLDLAQAAVDLSNLLTAYQAVLTLTARLFEMPNLFELER